MIHQLSGVISFIGMIGASIIFAMIFFFILVLVWDWCVIPVAKKLLILILSNIEYFLDIKKRLK